VEVGIAGAAGAPGGAVGLVAPGSCLAVGRLFDRPCSSAPAQYSTMREWTHRHGGGSGFGSLFTFGHSRWLSSGY
jgi:hypothetical protein